MIGDPVDPLAPCHDGRGATDWESIEPHLPGGSLDSRSDPWSAGNDSAAIGGSWRKEAPRQRRLVRGCLSFLPSSLWGPPVLYEASEGLAPFPIVDGWTPFVRLGGRVVRGRGQGNPRLRAKSPMTGDKDRRSIRCPARIRPLEKPDPVFELKPSGRAPALHACECLTNSAFEPYPLVFAMRGGSGRFPSGAFRRLSSSDCFNLPGLQFFVKEFPEKLLRPRSAGRQASCVTAVTDTARGFCGRPSRALFAG